MPFNIGRAMLAAPASYFLLAMVLLGVFLLGGEPIAEVVRGPIGIGVVFGVVAVSVSN